MNEHKETIEDFNLARREVWVNTLNNYLMSNRLVGEAIAAADAATNAYTEKFIKDVPANPNK